MNETRILHQKKVKLMGTILIVLSILSVVFMSAVLMYLGNSYKQHGAETTVRDLIDFELDPLDLGGPLFDDEQIEKETQKLSKLFQKLDREEIEKIVRESYKEAEQMLEDNDLIEELEFANEPIKLKQIFTTMILSTALTFVIAWFLIMIGRSWRRLEPFSRSVVIGLRGLGITFLAQLVLDFIFAEGAGSVTEVANSYPDYGFTMAPLLSLGILLLSLSWVIEYGQKLNEAEQLTI